MATLVLTAVGTIVGGPIGGAIGAAIGSQIDQRLLAPSRKGPRLGDLAVQTSSYGSAIPKLFGTMRVAGTVIWATDLREDTHRSGGKGGKTTSYSYSASFAVALSARPIAGIGRIWADGNLLRGGGGDWKSETGFRLHLGDEEQTADPLIASAEGIDATPAHRGLAYAVFEGLQLGDFGNRIPSLTFEVIAEAEPVAVSAIAAMVSDGAVSGAVGATVGGYAASGETVRGALEALTEAFPMPVADDGVTLRIAADATQILPEAELGAQAGDGKGARLTSDRRAAAALPDEATIGYYEPGRDYQAGLQRARRDGIGARAMAIELPASIAADQAKGLAEAALARAWAGRAPITAHLPWRRLEARAGSRATLGGIDRRITGWTLEKMALTLTLEAESAAGGASAAVPGRATGGPDAPPGATVLEMLDLPALGDGEASAPQVWLAAAGTGAGWRRAEASLSLDGGASWHAAGRTALPATMGSAATVLRAGPADAVDRRNRVEIELLHEGMALAGADLDALVGGANAALLGEELIQFGTAARLGPTRWRLGMLLRGRRGSEGAMARHASGERFVLIEPATLLALDVPLAALGTEARAMASGPGDGGAAATAALTVIGRALRPPAPVALSAIRLADATIRFGWTRRSRSGWAWLDGGDAPLGEDGERYRLEIAPGGRAVEPTAPGYDYPPAEQAADGLAAGATVTIRVTQLGTRAASLPAATASWTL